ncbi:MAG: hypothetical protein AB1540_00295 [Bdellovibrionota bacterium]
MKFQNLFLCSLLLFAAVSHAQENAQKNAQELVPAKLECDLEHSTYNIEKAKGTSAIHVDLSKEFEATNAKNTTAFGETKLVLEKLNLSILVNADYNTKFKKGNLLAAIYNTDSSLSAQGKAKIDGNSTRNLLSLSLAIPLATGEKAPYLALLLSCEVKMAAVQKATIPQASP